MQEDVFESELKRATEISAELWKYVRGERLTAPACRDLCQKFNCSPPLLKSFMDEDTAEIRAKFLSTIPLGRFSTSEDIGNAACFLCSDRAIMIKGVAMEVDGGRYI